MTIVRTPLLDRVFNVLADMPSPEDILAISATPEENARMDYLTRKAHEETLTEEERIEAQQYVLAERYVQLAKARALVKLNDTKAA